MTSFKPVLGTGQIRARNSHAEPLHMATWANSALVFDHRRWVCEDAQLRWTAPHHLIVLTEKGKSSRTRTQCDGEVVYDGRDRPGALTFVPAGVERVGLYREVDLFYSALWIAPTLELAGCTRLSSLPILVNRQDAVISSLLASLRTQMSSGHKPETVYVEHLAALVMLRIAALDGSVRQTSRHGRLSHKVLAHICNFIEAHVASDISLTDLAGVAGMRVDSFARRFKATTGQAPYAYVLERRVQHAERLLSTTDMPIGAIAHAAGFSSQSHFTSTLRRLRGTTPGAYRANFFPEC